MLMRRLLGYIVAGALLVAALVFAFWPQPLPVDLALLDKGELIVTIDGDGQTRVREIYVVSAPITGRVLRAERHVGDQVVANETVLATIQPTDPTFLDRRARAQAESVAKTAEAGFALSEAEQARALAELDFAASELRRAEQLAARGNVSQRDLDRAKLLVRTARAALATTKATVEMRRFELETARAALIQPGEDNASGEGRLCCVDVSSPVDGRVLRVIQQSEGVVLAGAPLVEVGDSTDLEIVVDLLSSDAVRVTEGAPVMIGDWGGVDILEGKVRQVEPYGFTKVSALGIEEQRVNVLIDFTGAAERWRDLGHGYRIEAGIVIWKGQDVLRLPLGALFRDGDRWAVFAAVGGVARLRHVEIDHSNGRQAQVTGGLQAGDMVILHPSDLVADGVRVVARSE